MARVDEYEDKFLWSRAVCDDCGWKSPTAHSDPEDAEHEAANHEAEQHDAIKAELKRRRDAQAWERDSRP